MTLKAGQILTLLTKILRFPIGVIRYVNRRKIRRRKLSLVGRVLTEIIPKDIPYHYDSVFSFLQRDYYNLEAPLRVDLFLPDYPLAIDFIYEDMDQDYRNSRKYVSREEWNSLQEDLIYKQNVLESYRCPYLVIKYYEALDSESIRRKIEALIDISPNR